MAKGQKRSNRELKKPKKSATTVIPPNATVATLQAGQRPAAKPAKK